MTTQTMHTEETDIITEWEKDINEDSWDCGHSLLIEIKPEFVEEAKKRIVDLIEDEGVYYLSECAPSFWMDVDDEVWIDWAIDFFECEHEWIADVSING